MNCLKNKKKNKNNFIRLNSIQSTVNNSKKRLKRNLSMSINLSQDSKNFGNSFLKPNSHISKNYELFNDITKVNINQVLSGQRRLSDLSNLKYKKIKNSYSPNFDYYNKVITYSFNRNSCSLNNSLCELKYMKKELNRYNNSLKKKKKKNNNEILTYKILKNKLNKNNINITSNEISKNLVLKKGINKKSENYNLFNNYLNDFKINNNNTSYSNRPVTRSSQKINININLNINVKNRVSKSTKNNNNNINIYPIINTHNNNINNSRNKNIYFHINNNKPKTIINNIFKEKKLLKKILLRKKINK